MKYKVARYLIKNFVAILIALSFKLWMKLLGEIFAQRNCYLLGEFEKVFNGF